MIVPFTQVLSAKVREAKQHVSSPLKYLIFNLHDTNISNFLRSLGYWEKYGYEKHVRFGSSVRLELVREKDKSTLDGMTPDEDSFYKVRFVYDDEEIHLPFCKELYCTFEEYENHI